REIGVVTGIVGAAGGVGGFLLPFGLKALKGMPQLDSYAYGFGLFAFVGLACAAALRLVAPTWEGRFVGQGGLAAKTVSPVTAGVAIEAVPIPVADHLEVGHPVR